MATLYSLEGDMTRAMCKPGNTTPAPLKEGGTTPAMFKAAKWAWLLVCIISSTSCARTAPGATPAQQPVAPMATFSPAVPDGATVIFAGTVVSRDSSTHITTVKVSRSFRSPEPIGPLDGTTVRLVSDSLPISTAAVFYGTGIAAGTQLVIQEMSSQRMGAEHTPMIAISVQMADVLAANTAISTSARHSDAVVTGIVESTRDIALSDSARGRLGEHSPHWREASVRVTSALRPADRPLVGQVLPVMYDAGSDESDREAARLVPPNSLVLLLRRSTRIAAASRHGIDVTGRYFVFDPADVLPASDSARVAQLVK